MMILMYCQLCCFLHLSVRAKREESCVQGKAREHDKQLAACCCVVAVLLQVTRSLVL
jgi:hypothetical protein